MIILLIILLLLHVILFPCLQLQSWNILQDELSAASKSIPVLKSDLLSPELYTLFFHVVSLISILTMNHLIIPPFPGFRMKFKIGAGVVFSALAPATVLIIQIVTTKEDFSCSEGFTCHQPTQLLWLIIPVIFGAIGLMHIFTAGEYCTKYISYRQ